MDVLIDYLNSINYNKINISEKSIEFIEIIN